MPTRHPDSNLHRLTLSRREALAAGAALASLATGVSATPPNAVVSPLDRLKAVGEEFTVALVADPQVEGADARGVVAATSSRKWAAIVDEVNALPRPPAFVVVNGDCVNAVKPEQVKNFLGPARRLKALTLLVHGNHDGWYPYDEFRAMQRAVNGTDLVRYSFDCGRWHFVTIPCNFRYEDSYAGETLEWLAADLAANRGRPTVGLIHYHLMPVGLTQLEWYTYEKGYKKRLLEALTRHGNVKLALHGHVHNGIQTSVKTAWRWRGTRFVVAPTCIASRPFGEEFEAFRAGLPQDDRDAGGGYYLLLDFRGDAVRLRGRLAGVKEEHAYPETFPEYRDQEPLWLADLGSLQTEALVNGGFAEGLSGWRVPYRYRADEEPGFVAEVGRAPGTEGRALRLAVREKGQHWAHDETREVYQRVAWAAGEPPRLRLAVRPDGKSPGGGGYVRVEAFAGPAVRATFLVTWGRGDRTKTRFLAQTAVYTATGRLGSPFAFLEKGRRKEGLFWHLGDPEAGWHDLVLHLPSLYDAAQGREGAFAALQADALLVALGVWCEREKGSWAEAWFGEVALANGGGRVGSSFDGRELAAGPEVFQTELGREAWERQQKKS